MPRWALQALWAMIAAATVGCGADDGPAGYVGQASNATIYVTWTRSGDALTGQLTQALISQDGDGEVDTQRVSFEGAVDGSSVSLRLDHGLGTSTTLTGKLDDDVLALDYPGVDDGVRTMRLREGDGEDFNAKLAVLRDDAADAKRAADARAAEQRERDDAARAADAVWADIEALERAADAATATNPDLYRSSLDTIRSALETARSSYEVLTQGAENGYGTVCDDASVVGQDVDNVAYEVTALRKEVKTNSDASLLDRDVRELRAQLEGLRALDPARLPDGAPTEADVDEAIRSARRTVRLRGGRGAGFAKAEQLLADAKAIKAKAQAACQRSGG
jgi:hypothetical protein